MGKRSTGKSGRSNRDSNDRGGVGAAGIAYLEEYHVLMGSNGWQDMPRMFSPELPPGRLAQLWEMLCDAGEELQCKYAWAIPDERALRIIQHFGPVVEVGAGGGYWCKLLQERGTDALAYDIVPGAPEEAGRAEKGKAKAKASVAAGSPGGHGDNGQESEEEHPQVTYWTRVLEGGPEKLVDKGMEKRTLLLCYPDDFEHSGDSMALAALEAYCGDTLIHVGELFGDAVKTSGNGCWGRTTGQEFQQALMEGWHCLLKAELPRWPVSGDCITVWRRHTVSRLHYGGDGSGSDGGSAPEGDGGSSSQAQGANAFGCAQGEGTSRSRKRKRQQHLGGGAAAAADDAAASDGSDSEAREAVSETSESSSAVAAQLAAMQEDDDDMDMYVWVPPQERLCADTAIESLRHLLTSR